jgi:hypothetical protein
MSRRFVLSVRVPLVAGLAVIALAGCGGHDKPAPAPPPMAAQAAAASPQPDPSPAAAPSPSPGAVRVLDVTAGSVRVQDVAASPSPASQPPSPDAVPPPAPLPDPNAKPVEKPVDPLKWLQDGEARRADYQRRLAEAESEVADAGPPVALWERNVLAIKNPFLAPPKWSDEDKLTAAIIALASEYGIAHLRFPTSRFAWGSRGGSFLRSAIMKALETVSRPRVAIPAAQSN